MERKEDVERDGLSDGLRSSFVTESRDSFSEDLDSARGSGTAKLEFDAAGLLADDRRLSRGASSSRATRASGLGLETGREEEDAGLSAGSARRGAANDACSTSSGLPWSSSVTMMGMGAGLKWTRMRRCTSERGGRTGAHAAIGCRRTQERLRNNLAMIQRRG